MNDITTILSGGECREIWKQYAISLANMIMVADYDAEYKGLLEGVQINIDGEYLMKFDVSFINHMMKKDPLMVDRIETLKRIIG